MKGYTAIMTILLIVCCIDAYPTPTTPIGIAKVGKPNRGSKKDMWWENPCALPKGGERHNPTDEKKSHIHIDDPETQTHMPPWQTQLGISIQYLAERGKKYIETLQTQPHFSADNYNHTWLPKQPCHWWNKINKKHKENVIQPVRVMTELYKGLQKFAITINCIMRQPTCKVQGQKPNWRKKHKEQQRTVEVADTRMSFFNDLKNELKKLLCEVQTYLRHLDANLPPPPKATIIKLREWVLNPDESQTRMQDWGVLSQYIRYLTQWEQIAKEVSFGPKKTKKGKKGGKKKGTLLKICKPLIMES